LKIVEAMEVPGLFACRNFHVDFCTPGKTMPILVFAGFFFDQI
jgi:hypothetical protein